MAPFPGAEQRFILEPDMKALPTPKKGDKGSTMADSYMPSTIRVPVHESDMKKVTSGQHVEIHMKGHVVGTHAPLKGEKGPHHVEIQPTHTGVKAVKDNQFEKLTEDDDGDGE